jgi:hypothetical protein
MRNDVQWILVVVVNCAEELMVIVDGSDSGRCQLRRRGARVTQAKAGRGPEVEGERLRAGQAVRDTDGPVTGSGGHPDAMRRGSIIGKEGSLAGKSPPSLESRSFLMGRKWDARLDRCSIVHQ